MGGVLGTAGDVLDSEPVLAFRYAASYLGRPEALSLFTPELPLADATYDPRRTADRDPLPLAGYLRDAAPDAWGRRVINLRRAGNPEAAALHGTSIDGARPKALLVDGERQLAAKFSSSTDTRPVVKAEAVAMLLAARAGIDVAPAEVRRVSGRDVPTCPGRSSSSTSDSC